MYILFFAEKRRPSVTTFSSPVRPAAPTPRAAAATAAAPMTIHDYRPQAAHQRGTDYFYFFAIDLRANDGNRNPPGYSNE